MNKFLLIFGLAALFSLPCCICCTPIDDTDTPSTEPESPKVLPGTYKFTASTLKGRWEVGDKILVRGSDGSKAQTIILSADDISADGKTATAILGEPVTSGYADPDGLYAAYPAEVVRSQGGTTDCDITFETYDGILSVAYLSGDSFDFVDATTYLSFSVSGDYDSYAFADNQLWGLSYNKPFYTSYSSENESISAPSNDGNPFRKGSLDGSVVTLWFPGGVVFMKGFSIYVGKDGEWSKAYISTQRTLLATGDCLELGDISSELDFFEGLGPNMPEMGEMTKYTVSVNELSGICLSEDGSFIWGVGDGSDIAKLSLTGEVLSEANLYTKTGHTIDSEAISLNYDTGDLLIGGEPNVVSYIPAEDVENIFASSKFKGVVGLPSIAEASRFDNSGIEGIAYYKDGLAYAGAQTGANLYCYELATGKVLWMKPLGQMFPALSEIAGLSYDPLSDWLWVVDSNKHRFYALTGDAEQLLCAYSLKSRSNEESICVDQIHKCIWIGDDYGSTSYLYKYEFPNLDDYIISH